MIFLVFLMIAYLLGSIPTGQLVVKRARGVDIRDYSSGNIGAANVFRVVGPKPAALVLVIDLLKGFIPVGIARFLLSCPARVVAIGVAATCGHIWSVFLGFKGGKGVLTALGSLFALAPTAGAASFSAGVLVMGLSRLSSLGSLTGTMVGSAYLLKLVMVGKKPMGYIAQALVPPLIILYTHRENIKRLLSGTENRLRQGAERRSS